MTGRIEVSMILIFLGILMSINCRGQRDSMRYQLIKNLALPSGLMISGIIINKEETKQKWQEHIIGNHIDFHTRTDDYFQLVPTGMDIIGSLIFKNQNHKKIWSDILIAESAMYLSTRILKKAINAQRPNGRFLSFPSGHTAQAFTGATLLYHHYKDDNWVFASSGFLFAGATGVFRVLNNEHWVSDVVFSAGLGTAIGYLTFRFNPLGRKQPYVRRKVEMSYFDSRIHLKMRF